MTQFLNKDDERAPNERPVSRVGEQHLKVTTPAGSGSVPLFVNGGWPAPQRSIKRAVILIHGRLRNADTYFELAQRAHALAGGDVDDTLLIVPQFLASADIDAHPLPPGTLHWTWTSWMGGEHAQGPAPLSSFDVLDAILRTLADSEQFASLTDVVIAGHSGGGQVVQRYAVVAHGEAPLLERGVALRYVIANPSSYVYFDERRPSASGEFATFDTARCPLFNHWKYGLVDLPAYAYAGGEPLSNAALEAAYVRRDVVVLLGRDDCDPMHPALDRSCAAQAQGANRLARGRAYARYMAMRHPDTTHRTLEIAGVAHDAHGIFASAEGLAEMFDVNR